MLAMKKYSRNVRDGHHFRERGRLQGASGLDWVRVVIPLDFGFT